MFLRNCIGLFAKFFTNNLSTIVGGIGLFGQIGYNQKIVIKVIFGLSD